MFKTFNFGLILGLAAAGAFLWYVPVVDQYREGSHISVHPNGGNSELFQINLPADRILAGVAAADYQVPEGLEWPDHELFADSQTELFKVRDRKDVVVGVASRIASSDLADPFIHWMLHLPARGTIFLNMSAVADVDGYRSGFLQAGTREFAQLSGAVKERFVDQAAQAEYESDGRIELTTAFVAPLIDDDDFEVEE